jgi:hypothetical protein
MDCSDTIKILVAEADLGALYNFGLTRYWDQGQPGPVYAAVDQCSGVMEAVEIPDEPVDSFLLRSAHWTWAPHWNYLNGFSSFEIYDFGAVYFSYPGDNETLITEWSHQGCWGTPDSLILWGNEVQVAGNYTGAGFPTHEVLSLQKFVFDPSKIHLAQWAKAAA